MTLGATLLNPSGEVIAHHEQQTPKFTNAVELRIAHQATQPGTYYVRVFGDTGADPVETVNYDLSVTGGSYPDATPPTARIAANATEVNVSEPVSFDASASTDDVGVDAISWDLDDDGAFDDATGETATTSFETPGEHSVSVRVTDRGGNADTATATVTVAAPADATSVEVAIAGSDGQLSLTELQRAIQYWATSEPVPGTDGGTLTIMELQSLIQTWASGGSIAAAG
jgi:PKD repeat protein